MDYKHITLEEITEAVNKYFYGRDKDPRVKPNLVIVSTSEQFLVKIGGPNRMVYTGFGGLRLFCKSIDSFDLLKVEFNGVILSLAEKQLLYNKIINDKNLI